MPPLLSPIPTVSSRPLARADRFVILACDGVWDYLSIDEAADVLCRAHDAQSSVCAAEVALRDAAAALADAALESGSSDNVSVLLVQLPDWKG